MNSETTKIAGVDVEYVFSKGKASTVVLVNGSGGPLVSWLGVWDHLEPHVNVLAYNRPGVGRSSRAAVPQTLAQMASDLRQLLRRPMAQRRGNLRKLAEAIPGCTVVEFTKSGHFPQITEPQKTAEVILRFSPRGPTTRDR